MKGEQALLNMLDESVHTALNNGLVDDVIERYDPKGVLYFPVALPYR
jgi:hypothetical protein